MKRKRLIFVIVVVALVSARILCSLFARPPDMSREKFDQIEVGMSSEQVYRIMAVPEGDYTSGPMEPDGEVEGPDIGDVLHPEFCSAWYGDQGIIEVQWGSWAGPVKVVSKRFVPGKRAKQDPIESLQWYMKRGWRRLW
jgi:hypothetical protein